MDTADALSFWDLLGPVIYLPIILFISITIKNKKQAVNPAYKYYAWGLVAKFIGAIFFCLIYAKYYKGGDTINYYFSSIAMNNLMSYKFSEYWDLMTGGTYWYFNMMTGIPAKYMFDDPQTFFVVKLANPFVWLGLKSFITASILISWVTYNGIWRFYLMFTELYPKLTKQLAYVILFFPSPLFWGSGVAKDTFTYSATLWLVYAFYKIFIKRKKILQNAIVAAFTIYIILSIKPYIIIVLLPLLLVWLIYQPISRIKNNFVKYSIAPTIIIFGSIIGGGALSLMSGSLGQYSSYDKMITKAQVTQQDHLREEAYGTNNYDIGKFDGSFSSLVKVAPQALIAGLYRPFISEAGSIVMALSGLENLVLLILTLMIIFRTGLGRAFNSVVSEPLLLLSVMFTILFGFGIGLSAANFGALVRFKIPLIPFFASSIIIMHAKYKEEKAVEARRRKEEVLALASKKSKVPGFGGQR